MIALIQTVGLGKRYGNTVAVEGLSLEARPGEILGLLGPNGAGKTTTIRMLACLISPSAGQAWVAGYRVGEGGAQIRQRTGIVTESPGLYETLSAYRNLEFFATLYGMEGQRRREQIRRYLTMLELWEERHAPVATFSKGMRQKVSICRALIHEPAVLFLDEPTAGLDPEAARTVRDFIADLREEGRTILLCTHNLDEADRLCDRVAVLRQHLLALDTPARLRERLFGRRVTVSLASGDGEAAARAARIAGDLPFVQEVRQEAAGISVALGDPDAHTPDLVAALAQAGCRIRAVTEQAHSLEDVYLTLVREEKR
ncbi:MAG: ABC transporter ATP-binding protein [Bacillota bacterium]